MRMKKSLALIIAGGTGISTLALGLGTQVSQAATTQVTIEEPGSTTLDPTQLGNQQFIQMGAIMEGLFKFNAKNQIVPDLATGYKVSNQGLTWTITIRKGAKFSNGDPITAKDFYSTWFYEMDPANSAAEIWNGVTEHIENSWAYHGGAVPKDQVGVKLIDDYTIQITTDQVVDLLPYLVATASYPLDEKVVEAHSKDWYDSANFPSDGPYMVKSFTSNGPIVLVKNPNFVPGPGDKVGNVDQITIIPTVSVPMEDFLAHKLDVAALTNIADVKYAQTHSNLSGLLHSSPVINMYSLRYDDAVGPTPLLNVKVRQAIAEAIDRAPIATKVFNGMVTEADEFATPNWPTYKYEKGKGLPYNVQQAQKLLAEAGYPNGKGLPTIYLYVSATDTYQVPTAEALAQELQNGLGINCKIVQLSAQVYGELPGAIVKGIQPGYYIGVSGVLREVPGILPLQPNVLPGMFIWSQKYDKNIYMWENTQYNAAEVKRYGGNPADTKKGVSWSDWIKMNEDALADIRYLNAYKAKLPQYGVTTGLPLIKQWQTIVDAWRTAKTDAAKNAAWQTAWKTLGTYENSPGSASIGWNEQVIEDTLTPKSTQAFLNGQNKLYFTTSNMNKAGQEAAQIVNYLEQQGWTEPLFYNNQLYLANSNISGVQVDPWGGNFYNLQTLTVK